MRRNFERASVVGNRGLSILGHRLGQCLYFFHKLVDLVRSRQRSASADRSALQGRDRVCDSSTVFDRLTFDHSIEKSDPKRIARTRRVLAAARNIKSRSLDEVAIAEQQRTILTERYA